MPFMTAMLPHLHPRHLLLTLAVALACAHPAALRAETTTIKLSGGQLVLGEEQKLMLEASGKVLEKDYAAALERYNRVIAMNNNNGQAYIQRSVVKRQMGDAAGSQMDAVTALRLAEVKLQQNPNTPSLYYERGTAYRLLKDYTKAKQDIAYAIQLSNNTRNDWETDLKAIALEERIQ